MNYTGFVAGGTEYSFDNNTVLILKSELLDSNLEKLNSYYERLTAVKRTECDYQLVMFTEKNITKE